MISSLSPMAGYTDAAFRRLCSSFGATYVVSEMISAMALVMRDKKTAQLAKITAGEAPVKLQIFGHSPTVMAQAAEILLSGSFDGCDYAAKPAGIDINMGCPVKKIVSSGDGSSLMRDIPLASSIVSAVKEVCVKHGVPLSVKFRAGWDESSINAPEFAVAMAKSGCDRITLHCRTREQMYAPSARPEISGQTIKTLREAGYNTPVTGNGDIDSPEAAQRYLDYGCDEAAIGRAALGDPWLFTRLTSPESYIPPTQEEVLALVLSFVEEVVREKGEEVGIRESRGRAAHFLKGMRGSAKLRDALNHCTTLKEFEAVLMRHDFDLHPHCSDDLVF